jgi:putative tryptophan/tyrosine transport system substrate-binding protein
MSREGQGALRRDGARMITIVSMVLSTALLVLCGTAEAQPPAGKVPRIGFLSTAATSVLTSRLDAFRQGLIDLGYVEGKNFAIEYRSAEGDPNRLPALAGELVRLKVDCIVTAGDNPTHAAKQATNTIPIVMTTAGDPVRYGFGASLARPGGNITGLSTFDADLVGKRLALLKEAIPKLTRVALISDPRSVSVGLKEAEPTARLLNVQLTPIQVRNLDDLDSAFRSGAKNGADGVIIQGSGCFNSNQTKTHRADGKKPAAGDVTNRQLVPGNARA